MVIILFIILGAIGCLISLIWLGIAAFTTWYYRPKNFKKTYQFKA